MNHLDPLPDFSGQSKEERDLQLLTRAPYHRVKRARKCGGAKQRLALASELAFIKGSSPHKVIATEAHANEVLERHPKNDIPHVQAVEFGLMRKHDQERGEVSY